MTHRPQFDLFNRLTGNAAVIAIKRDHQNLKPIHLLAAVTQSEEAETVLKNLGFPFDALKENVGHCIKNYKKLNPPAEPDNKEEYAPIQESPLMGDIFQSALQRATYLNRDYIGYVELLEAVVQYGDYESQCCLEAENVNISSKQFKEMLQNKGSIWYPEDVDGVSGRFNAAADDEFDVLTMDAHLKERIIGQDAAIDSLQNSLKRSYAGLKEENKPVGSFLFAGPTGVGKTEVANQLAQLMDVGLVRFDMSEFMEGHSVSKFIGAPPGYAGFDQGGQLTDVLAENPNAVLLLDEIEKAHPDIFNVLLQIMDAGRITDAMGETIDCTGITLIMTSNVGANIASAGQSMGFVQVADGTGAPAQSSYDQAIKKKFSAEFRNRLDGTIVFSPLSLENIIEIADVMMDEMNHLQAAKSHNLTFDATPEAIYAMAEKSYDPAMGARPLKRLINEEIKALLTDKILHGHLKNATITIDVDEDETFTMDSVDKPIEAAKKVRPMDAKKLLERRIASAAKKQAQNDNTPDVAAPQMDIG